MSRTREIETIFSSRWCNLCAWHVAGEREPYYGMDVTDYVTVLPVTRDHKAILVRQYRPVVEHVTLEFPSGTVDRGETPVSTAARELQEETGFRADSLLPLGEVVPDTGRLNNRLWSYFAPNVQPIADWQPELGLEVVVLSWPEVWLAIECGELNAAYHLAVLMRAALAGHIQLPSDCAPL